MLCRFSKASCVVVGTFNIYAVQPPLLKEIGILPSEGAPVWMEANFTQPGFRYTSDDLNANWIVRPDRVIVEAVDPRKDCGADVANFLGALPWTRVTAVGSNAEYTSADMSGCELAAIFDRFGRRWKTAGYEVENAAFHVAIKRGWRTFNLQAAQVEDHFEITCNMHAEVKEKDIRQANETCQQVARNFLDHRREAGSLIRKLFSIEVSDEPDSDQGVGHQEVVDRHPA